jgi:hypothetical protein
VIAHCRDAADVAISAQFGAASLAQLKAITEEVVDQDNVRGVS